MTVQHTHRVQILTAHLHVRATLDSSVVATRVLILMNAPLKLITAHLTALAPTHMDPTHASVTKVMLETDLSVMPKSVPCVIVMQHAMVSAVYVKVVSPEQELLATHQVNPGVRSKRQRFH